MAENRIARELETREKTERKRSWVKPDVLPNPNPEAGYSFRWIRISSRGEADPMNVSLKLREGWEPVKAVDHPEIFLSSVENERFKDNVVIGGLMLCKTPTEVTDDRRAYFKEQADKQMQSVDNNLMRENDPRMPLFKDHRTKVTFGTGA
jgi:hypothetical protein